MIELLRSLTPTQWLLIGGGVLLLAPAIINLYKRIGTVLIAPVAVIPLKLNNLTSIVQKWESLDDACEKAGLVEAQEKLREVFLAFAKKPKPKPKIEKDV